MSHLVTPAVHVSEESFLFLYNIPACLHQWVVPEQPSHHIPILTVATHP